MTLQELLIYPKFLIRISYPYSDKYDALLKTLMKTEDQFEIYLENKYWIVFKKKNEHLIFKIWVENRFYGFLSSLTIYSDKAEMNYYGNIFPKRITAIRFWLKYQNLILSKKNEILDKERKYFKDLTNYLEKDL